MIFRSDQALSRAHLHRRLSGELKRPKNTGLGRTACREPMRATCWKLTQGRVRPEYDSLIGEHTKRAGGHEGLHCSHSDQQAGY